MINFILEFLFYFMIGAIINLLIFKYNQSRQIKEEMINEHIIDNSVFFEKIEHDGKPIWMVFSYRDDVFLAQGNTEEEATENLKKRFPEKDFWKITDHSSVG